MTDERSPPRIQLGAFVLTLPSPAAAPRMVSYLERNRDRFLPGMPAHPADYFTEASCATRLEKAIAEYRVRGAVRFVLFQGDEATGAIAGEVNYTNIVREPLEACYLGYRLDREREGQGVMASAVRAGNQFVFAELGLHRIMANYVPTNVRSARLLRRLGFTVEGYARDYLRLGGEWQDHICTALLYDDWQPS